MSQRGVEGLLGRMVTDRDFRQRFYQEPAAVCLVESIDVTERELEAILALDEARIVDFASQLDARIVRASLDGHGAEHRSAPKGRAPSNDRARAARQKHAG